MALRDAERAGTESVDEVRTSPGRDGARSAGSFDREIPVCTDFERRRGILGGGGMLDVCAVTFAERVDVV